LVNAPTEASDLYIKSDNITSIGDRLRRIGVQKAVLDVPNCTNMTRLFVDGHKIDSIEFLSHSITSFSLGATVSISKLIMDLSGITSSISLSGRGKLYYLECGAVVQDIDLSNCSFNSDTLDYIFGQLGTASKTITVTGNPGAGTCTTNIATAKGWTVIT
jgi:hypothetical protein